MKNRALTLALAASGWLALSACGGDPASQQQPTASQASALSSGWKKVSAGGLHTCAIAQDDTLWCWGNNSGGQLGDGTTTSRAEPTQVGSLTTWLSVSAGGSHTCALKQDHTLWCWGIAPANGLGAMGDANQPMQIAGTWDLVSAGWNHTCAITQDYNLWCWGLNGSGQLGNGSYAQEQTPVQIAPLGPPGWTYVATGNSFTCGVSGGVNYCWGDGSSGRLANGSTTSYNIPVPTMAAAPMALGGEHGCSMSGGALLCWGQNFGGQLGLGAPSLPHLTPVPVNASPPRALCKMVRAV